MFYDKTCKIDKEGLVTWRVLFKQFLKSFLVIQEFINNIQDQKKSITNTNGISAC